jgi:hypothetical protein
MNNRRDISKQGYKDNSPYKDRPYLDIATQNGIIDMDGVSVPLLANNVILQPNSGLHKFDTDVVREIPLAKDGGSVKQSPYDEEKFALKNQDGIIADMMRNGAFLPKFKMGAEKKIALPNGDNYKIKKNFDKSKDLPYIGLEHNNINDRVYYDKDDEDNSGNFNIIDVAQQMYDQKREHERTKMLLLKHKNGEALSNVGKQHLMKLGLIKQEKIVEPVIEQLMTAPPTPQPLSLEELDVSKDIKNVTLDGENAIPIQDQIGMYMSHVSGKHDGTPYEKKLKRIYDKLNRVYYKDSKNSGLSTIEYMKSLSNN